MGSWSWKKPDCTGVGGPRVGEGFELGGGQPAGGAGEGVLLEGLLTPPALTLPGQGPRGFLATSCPGPFGAPVKAVGPSSEPWGKCSLWEDLGGIVKCFI